MKKFFTIINILLLITLVVLSLYVFDIIDIPFLNRQVAEKPIDLQTEEPIDTQTESSIKVARKKSYNELIKKADTYAKQELYTLAIDSYTKASKQNIKSVEPLVKIGRIHLSLNEFEKAKEISLQVLKSSSSNTEALLILGQAHLGLREFTEAKIIFDSISPENQESKYFRGITTLYFRDQNAGRSLLEESISISSNELLKEKAQLFIDALDEFNRYQAGQPDHLSVLLARSYVKANQPNMAIPLVFNVLKERRGYRDAWIILGYSYLKIENYKDSVDALEEAKRQDPEKPETLFFLGLAYAGNNQIEEAVGTLELALENGYEPKIHVQQKLAELYFQVEEFEKASEKYEDVISINATDPEYFIRPVWIYIDKLNKPNKAINLAEIALLNNPDHEMSYNLLGWAQVSANDYINGKRNLEKALELNNKFDAPYLNLGWMYEKQNNIEMAKRLYKQAYEIAKESSVGDLAAERYNALLEKEINRNAMVNIF